jgi:hypothetical protein
MLERKAAIGSEAVEGKVADLHRRNERAAVADARRHCHVDPLSPSIFLLCVGNHESEFTLKGQTDG